MQDSQRGTGGDLLHLEKILQKDEEFLLWFVDNLCAVNVKEMKGHVQEEK